LFFRNSKMKTQYGLALERRGPVNVYKESEYNNLSEIKVHNLNNIVNDKSKTCYIFQSVNVF